jgi:hypothetical protein
VKLDLATQRRYQRLDGGESPLAERRAREDETTVLTLEREQSDPVARDLPPPLGARDANFEPVLEAENPIDLRHRRHPTPDREVPVVRNALRDRPLVRGDHRMNPEFSAESAAATFMQPTRRSRVDPFRMDVEAREHEEKSGQGGRCAKCDAFRAPLFRLEGDPHAYCENCFTVAGEMVFVRTDAAGTQVWTRRRTA